MGEITNKQITKNPKGAGKKKGITKHQQAEIDAKIVKHISQGYNYYQLSLNSQQLLGISYTPHMIKKHFFDGIRTMYGSSKPDFEEQRIVALQQLETASTKLYTDFYTTDDPELRVKLYGAISKNSSDRLAWLGKPQQVQVQFVFNTEDLGAELRELAGSVPADYVVDQDGILEEGQ